MTVLESVERDLAVWERRLPGVSLSAGAGLALRLAAIIDELPAKAATAASNCANSLDRVLERIEASLPAEQTADDVDELRAKRDKRRAG